MQKGTKFQTRSDAAKQRWVRDDRKEAFWRKHINAWKQSGESKRGYCLKNALSQSSFNAWNREIAIRDRERVASANAAELLAEPVELSKNPFVPLRLLSDAAVEGDPGQVPIQQNQQTAHPAAEESAGKQLIEILVPGGAVIRVDETCNAKFIGELFSILKGPDQC